MLEWYLPPQEHAENIGHGCHDVKLLGQLHHRGRDRSLSPVRQGRQELHEVVVRSGFGRLWFWAGPRGSGSKMEQIETVADTFEDSLDHLWPL